MEHGIEAYRSGDKSMLLWSALENHQTRSYTQAYAALEDLLGQAGNEAMDEHFRFPWDETHGRYLQSGDDPVAQSAD